MNAKKLLSLLLALTMMATISVTAFAEGTDDADNSLNSSQTTTVYTQVDPSYTVTIPAAVEVDYKETSKSFDVVLSDDAVMAKGYCLSVSVSSANDYAMVDKSTAVGYEFKNYINYSLSYVNYVMDGVQSAVYPFMYIPGQVMQYTISIAPSEWLRIHSGEYSDLLTFNFTYVCNDDLNG